MGLSQPGLAIRSLVTASGEVELSIVEMAVPAVADDEVVVEVQATPINPSDLWLSPRTGRPVDGGSVRH